MVSPAKSSVGAAPTRSGADLVSILLVVLQADSSIASNSTSPPPSSYPSALSLLNNATKSWRTNLVTTDLQTTDDLDEFLKRPFFLLVGVEAGAMVRWERLVLPFALSRLSLCEYELMLFLIRINQSPPPRLLPLLNLPRVLPVVPRHP